MKRSTSQIMEIDAPWNDEENFESSGRVEIWFKINIAIN